MTIDQLIRSHREIELMMGYDRQNVTGMSYSYRRFVHDMNLLHPGIVRGVQQMWNVMSGRIYLPADWTKVVNDLMELAASGQKYPPRPGPFWHPNPMSEAERIRAAQMLVCWQQRTKRDNTDVGLEAQIDTKRMSRIRQGKSRILPTELDRIAAAFKTDRAGFLQGPSKEGTGG